MFEVPQRQPGEDAMAVKHHSEARKSELVTYP